LRFSWCIFNYLYIYLLFSHLDFRVLSSSKHLLIGIADICFWWSVWLLSDRFYPLITAECGYTFLRGYALIIVSNLLYLLIRWMFYEIFYENYDHFRRVSFAAVFVTYSKIVKRKSMKFIFLRTLFPLCVYILVVGYIQIWRGLFDVFSFLVLFFYKRYNVNQVLSSVAFQLVVGVSLLFTRKNNAVNLCPTHEMFKHDEMEYLDTLFNLNNLSFMQTHHRKEDSKRDCEANNNNVNLNSRFHRFHFGALFKRQKTVVSDSIIDADFDIVKYFTTKLIGSISSASTATNQNESKNEIWQIMLESQQTTENEVIKDHPSYDNEQRIHLFPSILPSSSPHLQPPSEFPSTSSPIPIVRLPTSQTSPKHDRSAPAPTALERETTMEWESKTSTISLNLSSTSINYSTTSIANNANPEYNKQHCLLSLDRLSGEQKKYAKILTNLTEKRFQRRARSICITVQPKHLDETHNVNKTEPFQKERKKPIVDWRHAAIEFFGYIYAIHHRQIFLHIFGGMFWCCTWKIYDFATVSTFDKTASDIPGLVLIAVFCHFINHLVLFRFKELASGIYWKTFYELLCGLFTVSLWASVWYIVDIVAMATGNFF